MTRSRRMLPVVILAVFAACSRYDEVKNLASTGTSIVAFGDSLTAGYGAGQGEDYPSRLSARLGTSIVNAGANGDTTESALQRIDTVVARQPRIVLIGLGGNDLLRGLPIESTEANLRAIISRIHEAGSMAVLLGFRFPTLRGGYEGMYERVAEDTGALLIPDLLDGILNDPALKSDAIHPNAAGYELMAERVAGPLQKLIKAAEKATRP
ncbi:MAG TPA: arylesterase [Thermoanaerobaculia bacterium]|nr:arylesterase [Thermoanaerobaculia bacterium]